MITEKTIKTVGHIGGFCIGWAIGGIVNTVARPKGTVDTVLTTIGGMAIAFTAGKKFAEDIVELCYELSEATDNDDNV